MLAQSVSFAQNCLENILHHTIMLFGVNIIRNEGVRFAGKLLQNAAYSTQQIRVGVIDRVEEHRYYLCHQLPLAFLELLVAYVVLLLTEGPDSVPFKTVALAHAK
jgi:hypothetical protein